MEKDKRIFLFRKHSIGNLLDGKKERKRKGGRLRGANAREMRRALGMLLAMVLIFTTLPASGLVVSASGREAGLCEHHTEHTAECGYSEEDNTPCGYECRICPIEDLIAVLPDQVTKDNAENVREQLDEILELYRELTEDEQEQIDISRCLELQRVLDEANASMIAAETIDVSGDIPNGRTITLTKEDEGCSGHTFTGTAKISVEVFVESGIHDVTFSGLNSVSSHIKVGIASGATMNLTLVGENTFSRGIYVPEGATLTIGGNGSLNISGEYGVAGIGGGKMDLTAGDYTYCNPNCGTIIINGGTITATGGSSGAGIGGGYSDDRPGNGGTVTINGGTVTAIGGHDNNYGGAGIGGGTVDSSSGNGGTLTINGGTVSLTAGQYNSQFSTAYGFGRGSCDPNTSTGTCELTLADASYLTTASLDPKGKYIIKSALTADMIFVPEDMHYTSADMAVEIKEKVTLSGKVTICNREFTVDTSGWTLSVTKVSDEEYTATYTHESKGEVSKTVKILSCLHSDGEALTHHEEKEADCSQTGIMEYWECSVCGKKFSDQDGQTEITDTEIPIADHILTYHEGQEATCTAAGNRKYWDCSVCGKKFSDEDGQTKIADADIVIPVKTHMLTQHAGQEADCLTDGNIEYWSCDVCNKLFADSDGKKEITDIIISSKGHEYGAWESKGNGTHTHSCQRSGCDSTETEDCSGGTATYTEKAICKVCGGKYGERLIDVGAPTGEISISTNHWNIFLHRITFELFFKETEQVTITAQDNESGVASVSYYLSDSGLTEEEVKGLDHWTAENTDRMTFGIGKDKSCVVYAKITDHQGNVTYISSEGLVFDGTFPSITGVTDGKTYCTPQTVTVTDNNLKSVTVNGEDETLSNNEFTLGAASGTQTIKAADKAGNITTVTVTVNIGHDYGTGWKSDESSHWHECACGERSGTAAHTKDNGSVTKPATATETGIRTYKCSICGFVMRTEEIAYKPVDHNNGTGGSGSSAGTGSIGSSGSSAGTGSTGGSGSGSGTAAGPALKQPFIKDSSGREGWDVIRAEAETAAAAQAGGTVAVDMNGSVSVPGSVFAAIRGKDVTLRFDMGGGIIWSVNGRDVAAETAGDTDFSVKADAGAIPKGLVAETAGSLAHLELSLAHEGAFGFTATLTIWLTSPDGDGITAGSNGTALGYTGMYANLFYYNPGLRSLEFICAGRIGEDGTADLPFVHASDYTVILSADPMGGTGTPEDPQEPGETEKPQKPAEQAAVKSVKLSKTLYTYNGKAKKPSVTAVDTEGRKISGKYYTVSYQNNKKAGKATVTIKFQGGYSGTVKKTFTIRPAGTSIQKLTAASGGFTVKWKKKTAQTSGYQIQYSENAEFQGNTSSIFVKKNSTVKKTVKDLKAGKKYYVRIRTYKTVKADGKSTGIYSAWSRARRVKTLSAVN